ncbi:MAG: class I SAM-dependent methyltransferase [Bacteriovoracaceae bacterium]
MSTNNIANETTELSKLINLICSQNALQKKRISKYINEKADTQFWSFAESLSSTLNNGLISDDQQRQKAALAYNKMCKDFLSEQIKFKRTGKYSCMDAVVASEHVYDDPEVMRYYMVGLLLSYIFWPNHYQLFRFFQDHFPEKTPANYLEVGVGHGLFTSTMINQYPNIKANIVDISATSIKTAKEVLQSFGIDSNKISFVHNDYLKVDINQKFDFIIMGEVLEHVNDARLFMKKTKELLAPGGRIYLSTAANSPALDHVFHFHNVKEMRDMMTCEGLRIVKDLALPSDNIPEADWEKELVTINYCAILEHAHENR